MWTTRCPGGISATGWHGNWTRTHRSWCAGMCPASACMWSSCNHHWFCFIVKYEKFIQHSSVHMIKRVCVCVCVGWIKIPSGGTASQTVRTRVDPVKRSQPRRAARSFAVSSNTSAAAPETGVTLPRQTPSAPTPCCTWRVRNNTCDMF